MNSCCIVERPIVQPLAAPILSHRRLVERPPPGQIRPASAYSFSKTFPAWFRCNSSISESACKLLEAAHTKTDAVFHDPFLQLFVLKRQFGSERNQIKSVDAEAFPHSV